jgi:hypothetical protein
VVRSFTAPRKIKVYIRAEVQELQYKICPSSAQNRHVGEADNPPPFSEGNAIENWFWCGVLIFMGILR